MKNIYSSHFIYINDLKSKRKGDILQKKLLKYFESLEKKFPEYEPKDKVINKLLLKI